MATSAVSMQDIEKKGAALTWVQVQALLPKRIDGEAYTEAFTREFMRKNGGWMFARTLYLYEADFATALASLITQPVAEDDAA
jgi:hypothetical protein